MRHPALVIVCTLVLGCLPVGAHAADPTTVTPGLTVQAGAPPAPGTVAGCATVGRPVQGFAAYGFEPARGLTVYGPCDDMGALIWQGYLGHIGWRDLGPLDGRAGGVWCGCGAGCVR